MTSVMVTSTAKSLVTPCQPLTTFGLKPLPAWVDRCNDLSKTSNKIEGQKKTSVATTPPSPTTYISLGWTSKDRRLLLLSPKSCYTSSSRPNLNPCLSFCLRACYVLLYPGSSRPVASLSGQSGVESVWRYGASRFPV
jgi:hypothetical protein